MSKHHLHPALAALYAQHPRQAPQLNAAYELGLGDLKSVLDTAARPKPHHGQPGATCINEMPTRFVHVLNTAVLARCLDLVLPHYYEGVSKDERRITGGFQQHLRNFLHNAYQALTQRGVFRATEGKSALQASQGYAEEMADLAYECLHELNNNTDPRAPHAAMRMYNELNMVEAMPDTATA